MSFKSFAASTANLGKGKQDDKAKTAPVADVKADASAEKQSAPAK